VKVEIAYNRMAKLDLPQAHTSRSFGLRPLFGSQSGTTPLGASDTSPAAEGSVVEEMLADYWEMSSRRGRASSPDARAGAGTTRSQR